MVFNKDKEGNLIINFKINNLVNLILIRTFKILILCMLTGIIIYTTANYMGVFPDLFIIVILTAITSILVVEFFQKCIRYYFMFPLVINLILEAISFYLGLRINEINALIYGCIYGISILVGNFIISVLAVKFYLKRRRKNEKI